MGQLQDYASLPLWLDGARITQLTGITMTTNGGQQRVDLLVEGLGGFTPGAGDVTLEITFAVPIGGQEYPYQQKAANGDYVQAQVGVGKDAYTGTGKIMDARVGQSTGASVEGTATWTGQLKPMK